MPEYLEIANIGPVIIKRSTKAKNIILKVHRDQTVSMTIPHSRSMKAAREFLNTKIGWIKKQKQHYQSLPNTLAIDINKIDLMQAQENIFQKLKFFASKYKFKCKRVTFRCQKTRWGSCSSLGNISLNVNLAFIPEHLQDYVILHELCHMRHPNHSPAFWQELDKYTNNQARQLDKQLRNYPIIL